METDYPALSVFYSFNAQQSPRRGPEDGQKPPLIIPKQIALRFSFSN